MTRKRKTSRKPLATILLTFLFGSAAHADEYHDARAELVEAYQQQDYLAMRRAAAKALLARPEYPPALYNLAFAYALNDQPRDALRILQRVQRKGADFAVVDAEEFAALRELPGWPAYLDSVKQLFDPVGDAAVAAETDDSRFVPEGIAINSDGEVLLGSIRTGMLINASRNTTILQSSDGRWSIFGMRFHEDGSLWFASAAVAQYADVGDDEGRTGLFRLDVSSAEVTKAAELPQYQQQQVLGDLVIADANTIYTSDSLTGAIYRYVIDANEFETLLRPGQLGSPQGLVLDASGKFLYVADYIGGLYRIATDSGTTVRLTVPDDITDYGIDGLYRSGQELIVIQNGIRPNRVAALNLSDDGLAVVGARVLAANLAEFDEPTLGVVHGDEFFFVANSHWNRFERDNSLPDGLSGPIVLKIALH